MNLHNFLTIGILIFVLAITFLLVVLIVMQMGTIWKDMPPANSTEEWKMILDSSDCRWYNISCQRLACVINCTEINIEAGEVICVC